MNTKDHISHIYRYLDGLLSDQEVRRVNQWVDKDAANKQLFDEIKAYWKAESFFRDDYDYDTEAALENVKTRVQRTTKSIVVSRRRYFQIAAALLLLACVATFLWAPVQHTKKYSTKSDSKVVHLKDGSKVFLRPFSQITFKDTDDGIITSTLDGQAYFEVSDKPLRIFEVIFDQNKVRVLGTAFSINSKPVKGLPHVSVSSGSVNISSANEEKIVTKDQDVYISRSNKILIRPRISGLDDSWKTERMAFSNESLNIVIDAISRHFNTQIEFESNSIKECKVTAIFIQESIENVFDHIENTTGVAIRKENDIYYISGEICK